MGDANVLGGVFDGWMNEGRRNASLPPSLLRPVGFMNSAGASCSCVCPPATPFLDICAMPVMQSAVMVAACSSRERVSDMGYKGETSIEWLTEMSRRWELHTGRSHVFHRLLLSKVADSLLMRGYAVRVEDVRPRPRGYDSLLDPDAEA